MEIVLDASAILAVIVDEPEAQIVIDCTKDAAIVSPSIVSFEVANALSRMIKRGMVSSKEQMLSLIRNFEKIPMRTVGIDLQKALEIAWDNKIYAYDAFYLETAKRLMLPLITFDSGMIKIARSLGLTVLGGKNAGV
jgi:predicted nucleic acid-binding protein